jgi:vaccinia related kinase
MGEIISLGDFNCIYEYNGNAIKLSKSTTFLNEISFYKKIGSQRQIFKWAQVYELKYLSVLHFISNGVCNKFFYMIMPLCEYNLFEKRSIQKFSIQTTLLLTIRITEALQYIHSHGYVHANINSTNILVRGNQVYLADFELASKYITPDGTHVEYNQKKFVTPTSIDAHRGVFPSRRGDFHILGYCVIIWSDKLLPWTIRDDNKKIEKLKIFYKTKMDEFLSSSISHVNLRNFLIDVFNLGYYERPNYRKIIKELQLGLKGPDSGYVSWEK